MRMPAELVIVATAFGSSIVTAMLGPAVHAAIAVIVPKIPSVAGLDQLTAAPTKHGAGLNQGSVLFTQRAVVGAVAAVGGGATAAPVGPPAWFASAGAVIGQ